ncbi:MAG: diaminopimelate decarboxylase [Planctomycetes bacterium]|nr:diaminopimelate decarboxylase [Planctomycetota bacterium]
MDHFAYRGGELWCEGLRVADVAAERGTPLYLYSRQTICDHYRRLAEAFAPAAPMICYSVKANANLGVLRVLADEGSGFDVVSAGELFRVLRAGGDPARAVFAGVGKTPDEMAFALDQGVHLFNVESAGELWTLNEVALSRSRVAPVALRVNPDVDPRTHQYVATGKRGSKFGLDMQAAASLLDEVADLRGVRVRGVHMHIGSQITSVDPYRAALERVVDFVAGARSRGAELDTINIGGGFGVWYQDRSAPLAADHARAILPLVASAGCRLLMEPGRFIVANAGILVTRVLYRKEAGDRRYVIVDAGMNDLVRPALYGSHHRVWPVATEAQEPAAGETPAAGAGAWDLVDVVGPVCETGDFLAKERRLPGVRPGDLLAIFGAGAYGHVMASNYNARVRPPEVLVEGGQHRVVRRRETYEDLVRGETP